MTESHVRNDHGAEMMLAPPARFGSTTLRLTAEMLKNLSALSGVAYEKLGAIFPSLVAPTPAPTPAADEKTLSQQGANGS